MTSEVKEIKFNPLNIFKKPVNPKYIEFVNNSLKTIEEMLKEIQKKIPDINSKERFIVQINDILHQISDLREKIQIYSKSMKTYTRDGEQSLRKFEYLLNALVEDFEFNMSAFSDEPKEIYLLNIVSKWKIFRSSVLELFWNIDHSKYPFLIHTLFGFILAWIPFVNIISLIAGIYLIMSKDWRAVICGAIILALYFIQWINIINLAF